MATVTKDFRVKNGLIVEGTTGTINGSDILTTASTVSSDSITEGTSNLFFTDQRAIDAVGENLTLDDLSDVSGTNPAVASTGSFLRYDSGSWTAQTVDSDDISEGTTNLYYTNERVAELLRNASLTNISITGGDVGEQLVITAENGVADSTTDDLTEGTTNLYFTNQRALDATSAAYDPAGSAATAESNANSYTDGRETAITTAYQSYADQAEADAITSANSYTDGRETAITTAYQSYADTAEADAISTAAADATSKANTAESNANSYTDDLIGDVTVDGTSGNTVTDRIASAVSNLVDAAPGALDTLNELAAALGDDANFSTTVTNAIAEKVAKAGDTMTGYLTLHANPENNLHAATKQYVDNAVSTGVGDLDSDGVPEGTTNLYFTEERAQDAVAAAIAAGTHANITITYDDNANSISFEAENGVADSTTDDLVEGTTNLYFTDQRAVDALEAVVPNFTEVDINSVATQVAATVNLADTNQAAAYSFDSTVYRSAKFLVKAAYGVHTEVSEILVTLDTSDNIAITEYAIVSTNGSLITVTAGMSGSDVEILATAGTANTDVTVVGTLVA